jgi:hypothetical protein
VEGRNGGEKWRGELKGRRGGEGKGERKYLA